MLKSIFAFSLLNSNNRIILKSTIYFVNQLFFSYYIVILFNILTVHDDTDYISCNIVFDGNYGTLFNINIKQTQSTVGRKYV